MELKKSLLIVLIIIFSSNGKAETIPQAALASLKPLSENIKVDASINDKEIILYFWATWCPDCKEKLTTVFKDPNIYKNFNVYLVATDKDLKKIEHFQKKNAINPNVFVDETKELQKKLEVYSVPTFVRMKKNNEGYMVVAKQAGGSIDKLISNSGESK